jgi:hypothetical protein
VGKRRPDAFVRQVKPLYTSACSQAKILLVKTDMSDSIYLIPVQMSLILIFVKVIAVITVQSAPGSQPDKSLIILIYGVDLIGVKRKRDVFKCPI